MVQVRATNSGDRVFESHPQWVDCSDPACGDRKLAGEAGLELSTHCRGWDSQRIRAASGRSDLKNPPTSVGGISEF
jgi:hypothetical protein